MLSKLMVTNTSTIATKQNAFLVQDSDAFYIAKAAIL